MRGPLNWQRRVRHCSCLHLMQRRVVPASKTLEYDDTDDENSESKQRGKVLTMLAYNLIERKMKTLGTCFVFYFGFFFFPDIASSSWLFTFAHGLFQQVPAHSIVVLRVFWGLVMLVTTPLLTRFVNDATVGCTVGNVHLHGVRLSENSQILGCAALHVQILLF